MNKEIEKFLKDNINLIDNNNYKELYEEFIFEFGFYATNKIGEMTKFFLNLGVNPLNYMDTIPRGYLNNQGIKNTIIPNNITNIGDIAFYYCTSLTSVTIPNSVTNIGCRAFAYCDSLTSIEYKGTIAEWEIITKGEDWGYEIPSNCTIHCIDGGIEVKYE